MRAFFAKRGTAMPPSFRDDRSEAGSHGSTVKMEATEGGDGNPKPPSKLKIFSLEPKEPL